MIYFASANQDQVFALDSLADANFLPPGCVQITEEEASVILAEINNPPPSADAIRAQRDALLRNVYDVGVIWVQRELRMATGDAPRTGALNAKLAELDAYAVALQSVPEQPGFPSTINWPTPPTRSL